ncbi:MAG: transposon-encoded TnpW family protein [Lachnospiraceae bacterium]|nr:transposon-encoded TnpW family protein [Lachnospiraceae bacterium]
MNASRSTSEKKLPCTSEPHRFAKRIGSTTYEVMVYHSQGAKETMGDKIMRLARSEAQRGMERRL